MGKRWEYREIFHCEEDCLPGGREDFEERGRLRCGAIGFARRHWGENVALVYMGLEPQSSPDPEYCGLVVMDGFRPPEPHTYGCPASWYRTSFAASVLRYSRRVTQYGFSPSVALDRCEDPLVIELIRLYEIEVLRARAHLERIRNG